jgi:hypothetical protein
MAAISVCLQDQGPNKEAATVLVVYGILIVTQIGKVLQVMNESSEDRVFHLGQILIP